MAGVFPIYNKEIVEYKGYAAPMACGNWVMIHEQVFGGREIEVTFDTSASSPSTFTAEISIDTSFKQVTLICPCTYKFLTSDCACKTLVRFKSHFFGQFIDIRVKS